MIALFPEQHKLRHLSLGKAYINIRQSQHIVDIPAGLPVFWQTPGFGIVLQSAGVARPLTLDVLDELAVPGAAHFASLPPVEHKLGDGILHEGLIDTSV